MNLLPMAMQMCAVGLALAACAHSGPYPLDEYDEMNPATVLAQPRPLEQARYPSELLQQGQYMTTLLRCGGCHTDGALIGKPDASRLLAGSPVGIAYTNPMENPRPGVVYPPNLTPDPETGIGGWTDEQLASVIRTGLNRHGSRAIPVMPYLAYSSISEDDALAIAAYLKSLPPVRHEVPLNVRKGVRARAPYVHFGVYMSKELVRPD